MNLSEEFDEIDLFASFENNVTNAEPEVWAVISSQSIKLIGIFHKICNAFDTSAINSGERVIAKVE